MQTIAGRTIVTEGSNATQSLLRYPVGVAVDSSGNTYISDRDDNRVWKVDPAGKITTFAGNGTPYYGGDNGPAANAALNGPTGLAVDSSNNIYICDTGNNLVRMVTPSGIISTVAGNRSASTVGDGGPATRAAIFPVAVATDKAGTLYISEGPRVRQVSAATGVITTIAGSATPGYSGDNGPATNARLVTVTGLAVDNGGNLYLADWDANVIRKVDTKNIITTIGGTGVLGYSGDGAPATAAKMDPYGLAIDPAGTGLYLSEPLASTIRRIDFTTGRISIVAGSAGRYGFAGDGQTAFSAVLWGPYGITVDNTRSLIICDTLNQRVRKIAAVTSLVSTLAGTSAGAFLNHPEGISLDAKGILNVADTGNSAAKQINLSSGSVATLPLYYFFNPEGIAEDSAGNLYVPSQGSFNWYIYKYGANAQFSYYAGTGDNGFSGDNGRAVSATIGRVTSVITDAANNLYLADYSNSRIRKVDPGGSIMTIAGNGSSSAIGDNGKPTSAGMDPFDIALDKAGNFYVADRVNNRVRRFSPTGNITTVAGTGAAGFSGDNGPATAATLNTPTGVAVDTSGALYIADFGNAVLRKVTPDGIIHTIAGNGVPYPFNGDGGALQKNLSPFRVTVDNDGAVYVSDWANDRIRKLVVITAGSFAVAGGNNQSGTVGTNLPQPLTVKVLTSDGSPFPGAIVTFAVSSGSASLTPSAPQTTGNDGTASVAVKLGATAGPVIVTATVAGLPAITFSLTATSAPPTNLPQIFTGGVVSAGLSVPAEQLAAPNAILSIFGQNFAAAGTLRKVSGDDLVNGLLPTNLLGVCVNFGTQRAPIFLVAPGQLNVQAPQLPASGTVAVQVLTNCDTPLQAVSNTVQVPVQTAAPEFFYSSSSADGKNPIAAIDGVTSAGVGDPARLGPGFAPAYPGEIIQIYATGFGLTDPAFAPGQLPPGGAQVSGVTVTIDGNALPGSAIQYAGVAPLNAGLYQVNLVIPANLSAGDHAITISVNGVTSPAGSYITVAPAP